MKTTDFNEKYDYIDNKPRKKGGFGEIYDIIDKKVKTEYILKKIKKEKFFESELKTLLEVKGTNIVNIVDWYYIQNEKCYYLVLEKMDGDLTMMLNEYKNGMPSKLIRKIFLQINSGLKIMKKNGKAHRDLNPKNILFSYTNDKKTDFIVKIGDFGLSKDLTSITKETSSKGGTPFYFAPEIFDGKYSNKCDLYSIGVLLYVFKTGDKNFINFIDNIGDLRNNTIKNKKFDDEKLNNLIKNLVVSDPTNRMNWENYFEDPFFKDNDEDFQLSEESKIKIKILDKRIIKENYENKNCKIILIQLVIVIKELQNKIIDLTNSKIIY